MNNKTGYLSLLLVIGFISWYLFTKGDAGFKTRMEHIENVQKTLNDSVSRLKTATANRDEKLRTALQANMHIVDTLNASLAKINVRSKEIDDQIETNKKTIHELWDTN
jgi:methyl-accepting chemotaxis protein